MYNALLISYAFISCSQPTPPASQAIPSPSPSSARNPYASFPYPDRITLAFRPVRSEERSCTRR